MVAFFHFKQVILLNFKPLHPCTNQTYYHIQFHVSILIYEINLLSNRNQVQSKILDFSRGLKLNFYFTLKLSKIHKVSLNRFQKSLIFIFYLL